MRPKRIPGTDQWVAVEVSKEELAALTGGKWGQSVSHQSITDGNSKPPDV